MSGRANDKTERLTADQQTIRNLKKKIDEQEKALQSLREDLRRLQDDDSWESRYYSVKEVRKILERGNTDLRRQLDYWQNRIDDAKVNLNKTLQNHRDDCNLRRPCQPR